MWTIINGVIYFAYPNLYRSKEKEMYIHVSTILLSLQSSSLCGKKDTQPPDTNSNEYRIFWKCTWYIIYVFMYFVSDISKC